MHEVVNDLYDTGFTNDKLNLLFLENTSAQVAVKTPSGLSRRITIRNAIMQGSVWGGLCCTVLMDKLGQLMYSHPELLHMYKDKVPIPPLEMVDDILAISKCSSKSVIVNSMINSFIETKKNSSLIIRNATMSILKPNNANLRTVLI